MTGVQTCALPISYVRALAARFAAHCVLEQWDGAGADVRALLEVATSPPELLSRAVRTLTPEQREAIVEALGESAAAGARWVR